MQSYVDGLAFSHVLGDPKGSVFRVYLRDSRGRPVETKLAGITMAADDDVKAAFEGKTHIDPGGVLRTQYSCGVSGYIKWMVHILGVHVRGSPLSISCDVFVPPAAMLASLAAIPKSTPPVHLEVAPGPGDDGVGVERIGRGKRAERVAYATLVTKDIYVVGAIVLQHTLLQAMDRGARRAPLLALVTESLSARAVRTLHAAGIVVRHVPQTLNPTRKMFSRGRREDSSFAGWSDVFAKLHVWNMTEYDRIVMMDADTLIVGDPSPLLEMDELSAAPEGAGPPVAFNSGVFVLRPSAETHAALIAGINETTVTFDGADQGYLNELSVFFFFFFFFFFFLNPRYYFYHFWAQSSQHLPPHHPSPSRRFFVDRWNIMPYRFNLLKSPMHYGGQATQFWWYVNRHLSRAVVLHLTGPKPWQCGRFRECSDDGHRVPAFSGMWFHAWDSACAAVAARAGLRCVERYTEQGAGISLERMAVLPPKRPKGARKNKAGKNGAKKNGGTKTESLGKEDL
jgi:hypothetical protein